MFLGGGRRVVGGSFDSLRKQISQKNVPGVLKRKQINF